MRGDLRQLDQDGFVFVGDEAADPADPKVGPSKWSSLDGRAAFYLLEQALRQGDADRWFLAARILAPLDQGERFSEEAIKRAIRLDPAIRGKVEAWRIELKEDRRNAEGRFFSGTRIKLDEPLQITLGTVGGRQLVGQVSSYDNAHLYLVIDGEEGPRRIGWRQLDEPSAASTVLQLLQGKPAQSFLNAAAFFYELHADDAAKSILTAAARTHRELAAGAERTNQQMLATRERKDEDRTRQLRGEDKFLLTNREVALPAPIKTSLVIQNVEKPTTGLIDSVDAGGLQLEIGEPEKQRVPWTSLPAETTLSLFRQVLTTDNSGAWFRAGRILMGVDGGENAAKAAFTLAHAADPKLAEPIRQVWAEPKQQKPGDRGKPGGLNEAMIPPVLASGTPREGDARENAGPGDVVIRSDFESGLQHPITRLGPARFEVRLPGERQTNGFFLFQLSGMAGKTVQIDFISPRAERNWGSLNPVYSYGAIDDPANFVADIEVPNARKSVKGANGVFLPRTNVPNSPDPINAQAGWRYVTTTWEEGDRVCFRQEFTASNVYVAMKVPYTPALCDAYMHEMIRRLEGVEKEAAAPYKVYEVGQSEEGRPLWLVEFTSSKPDSPTVVFYAREHADEHDTSWVAQGVLEFMSSTAPAAIAVRSRFNVIIIPLLDPDLAVDNEYEGVIRSFHPNSPTRESLAFGNFFAAWIDSGRTLDVVFNLHNVESGEGEHLFPFQFERVVNSPIREKSAVMLHRKVREIVTQFGYSVGGETTRRGVSPTRLGGFLSRSYGTLHQFYEVNSQAPGRHLSLGELKAIGPLILMSYALSGDSVTIQNLHQPQMLGLRERAALVTGNPWVERRSNNPFVRELLLEMISSEPVVQSSKSPH